jgi:hypothetical protein
MATRERNVLSIKKSKIKTISTKLKKKRKPLLHKLKRMMGATDLDKTTKNKHN